MKSTYSRRNRGSTSPVTESTVFKKDNKQEQPFFSPASQQSFFKPNSTIYRKCEKCEAEDNHVHRMGEKKEEDKLIHKMGEKKEEDKLIHKMGEKKEEDKVIHKKGEKKKKDKRIHKMDEKKEEDKSIQKMDEKKEEDKTVAKKQESEAASGADQAGAYIGSLDGKGSSLPAETQEFFHQRMGHDFSHVRIHDDAAAAVSAKELQAKAYAVDHHVVFNKGQYNPGSEDGKKLLAHELTHVAQQNGNGPKVLKSASDSIVRRKAHKNDKRKY